MIGSDLRLACARYSEPQIAPMLIDATMTDDGHRAASDRGKAEYQAGERQPDQDEAAEIERSDFFLAEVRHVDVDQDQSGDADRQVEEEDPRPGEIGDDEAADRRADQRRQHRRDGDVVHRADDLDAAARS